MGRINKEARSAYDREYYLAHREKKKSVANAHYHAHKDMYKDKQLKRKYGISLEQYRKMCAELDWCCEICGKHTDELHVDHDHQTNKVRGLLCESCNRGLGFFWDDQTIVYLAAKYLSRK